MSYQSYKARINAYGGNLKNSVMQSTKITQRESILNSPSRVDLTFNNDATLHPCIVSDIDTFKKRRFLFLPDTDISIGDYVHHEGFTYLSTEQTTSETFPQLIGELCNNNFPIKTIVTKVPRNDSNGNQLFDRYGKPLFDDQTQEITTPCVVQSQYLQSSDTKQFTLPEGKITIIVPYVTPNNIILDYQFNIYGDKYKVTNIDLTNVLEDKGTIKIIAERVV